MSFELKHNEINLVNKVYGKSQSGEHLTQEEYTQFREIWPTLVVDNVFNSKVYAIDKYLVREYCRLENGIQVQRENPKWANYDKIRQNRESILELLIEGKVKGYESSIKKLQGLKAEIERDRNLTSYQYEKLRESVKKLIEDKDIQELKTVARGYVNEAFNELNFYLRNQHAKLESVYQAKVKAQERTEAEVIGVKPQKPSLFGSLFSRIKAAVF